jgi:hypothetical protein
MAQINTLSLFFSADRYFVEDGILQIVNVSHRDQGMYKCVASTPMDQDTASALLMVLGEQIMSNTSKSAQT